MPSGLKKTIDYAENPDKTKRMMFVSALNCPKQRAYERMTDTKKRFGKLEGNVAYHGFQSFRPGKVTPEECHAIGIETAKRMWGDDYEVLIDIYFTAAGLIDVPTTDRGRASRAYGGVQSRTRHEISLKTE